ncbi:N-acetyl sugar amidotransferase [Aquirufa antheringensis]|uniref:N-acetyl sugar amidotransferase n=1 Tax=Aquirufa antheringensis TaxID=2516559 RepID=A0A4Q9BG30_9BACT|nr:N-acetyl sugar amidotransferase [Aquirufa antheringensis]TBH75054.1 N-acetyl sugar amidotransferase [Aquirufa antheringensis]
MIVNKKEYLICNNCIMDTSDPTIQFDNNGICDYCNNFNESIKPSWITDNVAYDKLLLIAKKIKEQGKGKDFDCIIGLSGGLDSSYVAYIAKEVMGLRPLLLHVDAGWNTEQAVSNIEKLVNGLGLDLYTEVIDWEKMKNVQLAFLKAQIPDQDLPQDAAFFSSLYKFANKYNIKSIITGANYSTECCREPEEWGGYPGIDTTLFCDIISEHGDKSIGSFPLVDILKYKIWDRYINGMEVVKPLNLVPFSKKDAEKLLKDKFGWEPYLHKHHESRFTRFYEDYWLPRKFGYEKRRAHFSSLILTGQMTRDDALKRISKPEMDELFLKQEFEYVANKLDLTNEELERIFNTPNLSYKSYRNKIGIIKLGAKLMKILGLEKRLFR